MPPILRIRSFSVQTKLCLQFDEMTDCMRLSYRVICWKTERTYLRSPVHNEWEINKMFSSINFDHLGYDVSVIDFIGVFPILIVYYRSKNEKTCNKF